MSDDRSVELQNLLIEKLTADNKPAQSSTEPSTLGTIGLLILVTGLIIAAIVVVYYVFIQNVVPPYPLSPFKYGQKIVIRPAVLTDITGDIEKQYLTRDTTPCYRNDYQCLNGFTMGDGACVAKFTGDKNDANSQWVLMQFANPQNYDANQSLSAGLGNRFFLHNAAESTLLDPTARLRYQLLNESGFGMCYGTTPAVIGSNGCGGTPTGCCNWFESDLLVYFMPTNYKDIYYLLFPSCSNASNNDSTAQPNDGIVSIRPWAPNVAGGGNQKAGASRCYQCDNPGNYNPYNGSVLNSNAMIMNYLPSDNRLPPYPDPNVHLFKVTLA